jgi:hypothetical protein
VWRGVASHFERKRRRVGERDWLDVCVWAAAVYLFSLSDCRVEGKKAVVGGENPPPLAAAAAPASDAIYTVPPVPLSATSQQQAGLDSLTPLCLSLSHTAAVLTLFLSLCVCLFVCR